MDRSKQQHSEETQVVVSPLAQDKTYGERVNHTIFDVALNYWTNLLASAGFSQYAEHATKPVKLPFLGEKSPRAFQQDLAKVIRERDPFMQSFAKKMQAEKPALEAMQSIMDRSMARARSLTLLMPGFAVMIPVVWLGAKVRPWMVRKLNEHHYGKEAMNDPSMIARQQAIEAEARPTFLGTMVARIGTVLAVQGAAQLLGSRDNIVNKLGKNNRYASKFAIDPLTEGIGEKLGSAVPNELQERFNAFTAHHGLAVSDAQIRKEIEAKGQRFWNEKGEVIAEHYNAAAFSDAATKTYKKYTTASQDLGRFIAADTFYTLVSATTIHPLLKWLRKIPGMSYKPNAAVDSATFEGHRIKVPANQYADKAENQGTVEPLTPLLDRSQDSTPNPKVSDIRDHIAPNRLEPQIA